MTWKRGSKNVKNICGIHYKIRFLWQKKAGFYAKNTVFDLAGWLQGVNVMLCIVDMEEKVGKMLKKYMDFIKKIYFLCEKK